MEGHERIRFPGGVARVANSRVTIPAHAALAARRQRGFDSTMKRRIACFAAAVLPLVTFGCGGSDSPNQSTGTSSADASSAAGTGGQDSGAGGSGGAGVGSTTTTGVGGGDFVIAPHAPAPQVVSLGGPVLKTPKVVAITYDSDANQAELDKFMTQLAASTYWPAVTSEYGVGPLTVVPPIHISDPAPANTTDMAVLATLKANVTGAAPAWGAVDPSAIYTFIFPEGSIVDGGGKCCDGFDAYHDETSIGGTKIAYAIVCTCPGFDGPGINTLGSVTTALSHELVEAVTDPFPQNDPAFGATDDADISWSMITEGELADMCEFDGDQYLTPADMKFVVQRSWSNAAAAAGKDPCVPPSIPEDIYFNAVPVVSDPLDADWYFGPVKTTGVKIPLGQTKTIDVQLFSNAPMSAAFNVAAYDYDEIYGGSPNLKLTFDSPTGKNGDVLKLTIKVLKKDADFGVAPFYIESTSGNASNVWMGVVGQ
jgi:hypothetical protein